MSLPFSGGDVCIIAAGKREHMAARPEKIRGGNHGGFPSIHIYGNPRRGYGLYTRPWAIIASATLMNPAMLAPLT